MSKHEMAHGFEETDHEINARDPGYVIGWKKWRKAAV